MAHLDQLLFGMINNWYITTGYIGIILAMSLESCCIPLPSEIVMPLAGYFVVIHPGQFSLLGVTLAGAIGCLVGSAVAYAIGRAGGRPLLLRYGKYILVSKKDSDRADQWFQKYGGRVTFFSRLLPVIRTYISLPAGISEMSFIKFAVYTFLGSLPWCLLLAYVGTKAGEHASTLSTIFHGLDVVIIVLVVIAVALYIYRHLKAEKDTLVADAASAEK